MQQRQELRGKIIAKYGTHAAFGKAIGLSEQSISAKLNGRSSFSQEDIIGWCNALGIKASQIGKYFFDNKVSKS